MLHSYPAFLSFLFLFFLMIRRPPRSTLFPSRRSSDLMWIVLAVVTAAISVLGDLVESKMKRIAGVKDSGQLLDRKSTRLNSSHVSISYAVFCLKKKKTRSRMM